jgi:hypothetical protein
LRPYLKKRTIREKRKGGGLVEWLMCRPEFKRQYRKKKKKDDKTQILQIILLGENKRYNTVV